MYLDEPVRLCYRLVSLLKVEANDIVALSRVLDSETVQPTHKLPDHYKIYTADDLPITVRRDFGKDKDDEMSDRESDHVQCNWTLASGNSWDDAFYSKWISIMY